MLEIPKLQWGEEEEYFKVLTFCFSNYLPKQENASLKELYQQHKYHVYSDFN